MSTAVALVDTRISRRAGRRLPTNGRAKHLQRGSPKRRRYAPAAKVPKHVEHCFETGARDWWVYTADRLTLETVQRVPYRCNSWRCPVCCKHEAKVTFRRISDGMHAVGDPNGWVFLVLTLDRDGYYGNDSPARVVVDALSALAGVPSRWAWQDSDAAYRALGRMTEALRRRFARWSKKEGWQHVRNRWVAVVEAHRSGWPHVNVALYSPGIAAWLRDRPLHGRMLVRGELARCVRASGFGLQSTAEPFRLPRGSTDSIDAIAGYVTKLAGNAHATAGEIAKITQAPLTAPVRFRRLRSGKGFLPPRQKNREVTGTLVRRRLTPNGTFDVLPLQRPPVELARFVQHVCSHEEDLAHEESRLMWLQKRLGPSIIDVDGPPARPVTLRVRPPPV